jgi:hypothetical protein
MATKYSQELRQAASDKGVATSGVDLMRRINEGSIQTVPGEFLQQTREKVVDACEELLDVGARIRPLIVGRQQIGWVRGIHNSERRVLSRWLWDTNDYIGHVLQTATTLSAEQVAELTAAEVKNLVEVVKSMSDYDISLFPYLSAFVTTMVSENLWHGKGRMLSAFDNRMVTLPDGKQMKLLVPSDHVRLWATLATYREQAKKRLDESWNAVLIVRPMAGKSADPISTELKGLARHLQTDSMEPWQNIIKVKTSVNVDDGWAHAEDSREGLERELKRMLSNDRHEQLMAKFEQQQVQEAENNRLKLEKIIRSKGGTGITSESIGVETEAQVKEREKALRKGIVLPTDRDNERLLDPREKIKRYR